MSAQLINLALRSAPALLQYGMFKNGWANTVLKALGVASKGTAGSFGLREKLMIGMSAGSAIMALFNNFVGGEAKEPAEVAKESVQSGVWDTVNSLMALAVPGGDTLSTVQKVGASLFGTGALNTLLGGLAKSGAGPLGDIFGQVADPAAGGNLLANIGKVVASGNPYNLPQALVHLKSAVDSVSDSGSKWKLIPGIF